MDDFSQSDSLTVAIHRVSGKMSNEEFREVKRAAAFGLPRSGEAVAARRVEQVPDRPRFLSDRFRRQTDRRKFENNDVVLETFTLPLEAARRKVRAMIDDISRHGYREIVERWRQLPDGQIEFTMRRLPVAD